MALLGSRLLDLGRRHAARGMAGPAVGPAALYPTALIRSVVPGTPASTELTVGRPTTLLLKAF